MLFLKYRSQLISKYLLDDIGKEIDEFIKLGLLFGLGCQDWWWLGEQVLIQSVNISTNFLKDGRKREAICKYIYGKFLLENCKFYLKCKFTN